MDSQVGCFYIYCMVKNFNLNLKRLSKLKLKGFIGLTICGNKKIRNLNKKFRGIDRPTDVLSFPFAVKVPGPYFLGEIVISVEYLKKNSEDDWKDYFWKVLVHGLAHLEGHKHKNDKQHAKMLAREKVLLKRLGYV